MARLPTLDDLGQRPTPQAYTGKPIVVPNAGAVADAAAGIGDKIVGVAQQSLEREDKLNYATAKTQLLAADIQARQELQNDPDYSTYEQRYNERMGKAREDAAKLIGSRYDRRTFDVDTQLDIARGLSEVRQLATQKRSAADIATGLGNLDQQRTLLRSAPDEPTRQAVITAANETIQGMIAKGLDPIRGIELRRDFTSGFVKARVAVKLDEGDAAGAAAELEKGSGFVDDETYIALHHAIDQARDDDVVMSAASAAMGSPGTISGNGDFSKMVDITLGAESRGRRFGSDGKVLTSPKGAKGEMQVMPGTESNPGYGVAPMADDSHEERARVGRDYLAAMLTRYGSPEKAWAAYNAGPGRLDEALAKAEKTGKPWLSFMPAETRKYVTSNVAKLASVGHDKPETLEDAISRGVAALGENPDPGVVAKVRAEVKTRWDVAKEAIKERDNATIAGVQQLLVNNGGDWFGLPASVRSSVPAQYHDSMITFAHGLKTGKTDVETDPTAYVRLTETAARDPQAFAKINPISYRNKFNDSDWERLVAMRNSILSGKGEQEATSMSEIRAVTQNALDAKGVTTTGLTERTDPKGVKRQAVNVRIYNFEKAIASDVAVWQQSNPGKKPQPKDIQAMADRRLLQWNRDDKNSPFAFEVQPGTPGKVSIPTRDVQRLRAVGRRILGREPTEQQLVEAYLAEARGGM